MPLIGAYPHPIPHPSVDLKALGDHLKDAQQYDGAMPWWPGHKTDPWDHVEATMGLTIAGAWHQSRNAFEWLQASQLADGSWYSAYCDGQPADRTRETHHAAYIATGLYHYYLVTADQTFIRHMWPTVDRAIDFALRYQAPGGEIYWALNPEGRPDPMALVTGSSSIYFSLKCALRLAQCLHIPRPRWHSAMSRLGLCLIDKPHHFNMTKARFAMDWFYPVLCGAVQGDAAKQRIDSQWKKFVVENQGVRCVSDQPWVTIAESCEFILTLAAMGRDIPARIVFSWICDRIFDDRTFWCGFTVPDMSIWPTERITWTNAAVLLAADALYGITPGARLFHHHHWNHWKHQDPLTDA